MPDHFQLKRAQLPTPTALVVDCLLASELTMVWEHLVLNVHDMFDTVSAHTFQDSAAGKASVKSHVDYPKTKDVHK